MPDFLFSPRPVPTLPVLCQSTVYPVSRIFCVGRNYAAHAAEMGHMVDREAPFYFTKSATALTQSGAITPYAPGTADLHHEMELVVAVGAPAFRVSLGNAVDKVFGYACGLDMTRRDLQSAAKAKARPWDTGKDFENSAVIGALTPAAHVGAIGPQRLRLMVNGVERQNSLLADMVWSVPEIIVHLSTLYHLAPGDLIMTGTPAGVGPVQPGDAMTGSIDGLADVSLTIGRPE
jgi:fumarylpyruvate hydrolase